MAGVIPSILVPISAVLPAWLAFVLIVKAVDRYDPKSWWLSIAGMAWGGAVAFFSTSLSAFAFRVATGRLPIPLQLPVVEEIGKALFLVLLWAASAAWLRELGNALDGAIYGGLVGLGYALTGHVLLGHSGADLASVVQAVSIGFAHASFTSS